MENDVYKLHEERFGVPPNIIGMFWKLTKTQLEAKILESIEKWRPYDEYAILTEDEQKAFDEYKLVF